MKKYYKTFGSVIYLYYLCIKKQGEKKYDTDLEIQSWQKRKRLWSLE